MEQARGSHHRTFERDGNVTTADTAYTATTAMRESEDFVEGPKAFAEKRKPIWKGW